MVAAYFLAAVWVIAMLVVVPWYARSKQLPPMRAGLRLLLLWGFCWVAVRTWLLRGIETGGEGFSELMQMVVGWTVLSWTLCFAGVMLYLWRKPVRDVLSEKIDQIGR